MCSLVVTMEIHYYFDHSWSPWSLLLIYGHHRSLFTFVLTLRPMFYVPFWPISAFSKFGHEHIAQIYSVHVLKFRTHIFIYMLNSNPSIDSNERTCFPLYVHALLGDHSLWAYHTIAIPKTFGGFKFCVFISFTWFIWVFGPNLLVS